MEVTVANERAGSSVCESIDVLPIAPALGAEVVCGDVRSLNATARQAVRQAFLDHLVLLVRGQNLTDEELMDFGRVFGDLALPLKHEHQASGVPEREKPYIAIISNVVENGKAIGDLGDGEAQWHSDQSFYDVPVSASALYAMEIPPTGGNTGFLNMYRALETLPAGLRRKIEGRRIKHDLSLNSTGALRRGLKPVEDVRVSPGPWHPAIRTHPETGYNALYLGRRAFAYVEGLSIAESESVLEDLWAHATRPEFSWHHEWRVGDILIWDNRCTMHHRDAFDPATRRIMHRVQTRDVRPFFDAASGKKPEHPRGTAVSVTAG